MTFRRTAGELFCVIALFGLSRTASAQDAPKVEVFGGFSYANAPLVSGRANVNGWQASAAFNLNRWFGAAADFSGLYGGSVKTTVPVSTCPAPPCQPGMISLDGYVHTFLGGPRFSYRKPRATAFGHVLLGGARLSGTTVFTNIVLPPGVPNRFSSSASSFGLEVAGGSDYRLTRRLALRVQAGYLQTRFSGNRQDDFLVSAGLVIHFLRR